MAKVVVVLLCLGFLGARPTWAADQLQPVQLPYVLRDAKAPWYVDLLNLNLDNHDLAEAQRRIERYFAALEADGTRLTANLDFER